MSQPELVVRVVEALELAGIDYMVTGSLASSYQGEPRASHDADLVVSLRPEHVDTLVAIFSGDAFYLNRGAVESAVRGRGMFNLLHVNTGDKVDFWLLTDTPFDAERFARRRLEPLFDRPMYLSAAEDTILQKLLWTRMSGGSEKQFRDALSVYEVQFGALDLAYMDQWANELEIADLLARVKREADPIV